MCVFFMYLFFHGKVLGLRAVWVPGVRAPFPFTPQPLSNIVVIFLRAAGGMGPKNNNETGQPLLYNVIASQGFLI